VFEAELFFQILKKLVFNSAYLHFISHAWFVLLQFILCLQEFHPFKLQVNQPVMKVMKFWGWISSRWYEAVKQILTG